MPSSSKSELRNYVRHRIDRSTELSISEVVHDAIDHFSHDTVFMDRWIAETFKDSVYDIVSRTVQQTRGRRLITQDKVVDRPTFEALARKRSVFMGWMEHVGDRHIKLMEMSRSELFEAAAERQARGDHEHSLAELWRRLAGGMNDEQKVSERWSPAEIEEMRQAIEETQQDTSTVA